MTAPTGAGERAAAARRGAGLFVPADRGLLAVSGADRVRWLDGMVSNRIADRAPGPDRSGCYALLLTPQARIVADLHVLVRPDEIWLETRRAQLPGVRARLERYVIADDVALADRSDGVARLALEGPRAPEVLGRAAGEMPRLAPDCAVDVEVGGVPVCAGAWGVSGEPAFQILVPLRSPGDAEAVREALRAAGRGLGLVDADEDALEVLRVEAGVPRLGAELSEEVLPAEAGLVGRAVSLDKGCYTGQEIVARMDSRGRAGHHLVGLAFDAGPGGDDGRPTSLPAPGAEIAVDGRRLGELTSACRSALAGPIGLGYVRHGHEAAGTVVAVGGTPARVAALPFVAPGACA